MSNDVNVERLVPNFKDKTNTILERKCFIGDPIELSDGNSALKLSLSDDYLRDFIFDEKQVLRDDKQVCTKNHMLANMIELL